jgi:hypothetical protein
MPGMPGSGNNGTTPGTPGQEPGNEDGDDSDDEFIAFASNGIFMKINSFYPIMIVLALFNL